MIQYTRKVEGEDIWVKVIFVGRAMRLDESMIVRFEMRLCQGIKMEAEIDSSVEAHETKNCFVTYPRCVVSVGEALEGLGFEFKNVC